MADGPILARTMMVAQPNLPGTFVMRQSSDPVYRALLVYNQTNTALATPVSQVEPADDALSYAVEGSPQPLCRPFLRVQQLTSPLPSPAVRFDRQDDGLHLQVTFEEDPSKRPANAVPFNVTVRTVQLHYATSSGAPVNQILNFDAPLQDPLPPATPPGPAFTVVADAKVPDEQLDIIVAAMKQNGASWNVTMDFPWVQIIPRVPSVPAAPAGQFKQVAFHEAALNPLMGQNIAMKEHVIVQDPAPVKMTFQRRDEMLLNRTDFLKSQWRFPPLPPPLKITKTITIARQLDALYPVETTRNRPVFAAVLNDYAQVPWEPSAVGYYLPTPIPDTVYCVPDAYRLDVDKITGRPAIQMMLLKGDTDDDPKNYKIRMTMQVKPDFDPVRLDNLRTLVRRQLQIQFADLSMGGYKSASFKADEALAGLGEMFSGHSADDKSIVDAINGFSLTYEGRTEFIDDLTQRLKSTGIGGQVILQLDQPGDQDLFLPIPVLLTLRQLAGVDLPWQFSAVSVDGQAEDGLPRAFEIRNNTTLPMKVAGIQNHALQKTPKIGAVKDWCDVTETGATFPAVIAPGGKLDAVFTLSKPDGVFNAWSIQLVGTAPAQNEQFLLDLLLDHATQGVRGWKIDIDCPPLQFFDSLKPEDQAAFKDIIACDVQVKRKVVNAVGDLLDSPVESARLTKAAPSGSVLLSRTIVDFVTDRASAANVFLHRRRLVKILSADDWGPWQEETGTHASVFFN